MSAHDLNHLIVSFWQSHQRFLNNSLLTEQPHPETNALSDWAKNNLAKASQVLLNIDIKTLQKLMDYQNKLLELHDAIQQTIESGNKVFIAGCGASGRLAASLEYCWRKQAPDKAEQVISLIAGGDAALIRSIERCEDYPEYGIKQLKQQGFTENDLLIGSTASGESPFILGEIQYAAEICQRSPWLIYCNPAEVLLGRNNEHPIAQPNVKSFYIETGPMALTGSTRMQATTAMLLVIGLPLLYSKNKMLSELEQLIHFLENLELDGLLPFIVAETQIYQNQQNILYQTQPDYALTVLTDTTERSPTFNLLPFENRLDHPIKPAWAYLSLLGSHSSSQAWQLLLNRPLTILNWPDLPATHSAYIEGFDLSEDYGNSRDKNGQANRFLIKQLNGSLQFKLSGSAEHTWNLPLNGLDFFAEQILLKLILNILSTLVMGRLGFYQGNLMTSLYPSNHKLIDRAIRYTRHRHELLSGNLLPYEKVADAVFAEMRQLKPGESIVEKAVKHLIHS